MFKTPMVIALGLAMANLVCAQSTGSTSVNRVDYGADQPETVAPAPQTAPTPTSAPATAASVRMSEKPIQVLPLSSIPANVQEELKSKTDDYYAAKHQAIGFGIAGVVLEVAATIILVANSTTSTQTNSNGYSYQATSTSTPPASYFILVAAGTGCEVFATVRMINAIVRGVQLRNFEEESGYRISLNPVLVPMTGQMGALARVEF